MSTVAVLGTWDTKGVEHRFVADTIRKSGLDVVTIDAGVGSTAERVDIDQRHVARAGEVSLTALRAVADRDAAITGMARGARAVLQDLREQHRLDGVISLGGGGGSTLASIAMQGLPIGVPKLIVSTIAAGDVRPLVRGTDITLMYPVLDIAGLNDITRRILHNAASAISGMAGSPDTSEPDPRPKVGASMFGVTTVAVQAARARLEASGFDVLVFHATGSGGESLEALVRTGHLRGVLDLTTTELADDLVGGVMSAGPDRLTAASETGIPQVVSVGALDMVNLGPLSGIAPEFRERRLLQHAPTMTLMRTTPAECRELGRRIGQRLANTVSATIFLPRRGVSAIASGNGPFADHAADEALFAAIRSHRPTSVPVIELDLSADDPAFGEAMADELIRLIETAGRGNDVQP